MCLTVIENVPDTVLTADHLIQSLQSRYYYDLHLTDEHTEVQRDQLTNPNHKAKWQCRDSNPRSLDPGCTLLTIELVCLFWAKYHAGQREGIQINT